MIIWFTGVSGSGKTTLSVALVQALQQRGYSVHRVDGDAFREKEKRENVFSREEIIENNLRIIEHVQSILNDYDIIIVSVISPFEETRKKAREVFGQNLKEIFVDCPREILISRDPKGLYAKALRGEVKNLIGFSPESPYEPPENPDLKICTDKVNVDHATKTILDSFFHADTERNP